MYFTRHDLFLQQRDRINTSVCYLQYIHTYDMMTTNIPFNTNNIVKYAKYKTNNNAANNMCKHNTFLYVNAQ